MEAGGVRCPQCGAEDTDDDELTGCQVCTGCGLVREGGRLTHNLEYDGGIAHGVVIGSTHSALVAGCAKDKGTRRTAAAVKSLQGSMSSLGAPKKAVDLAESVLHRARRLWQGGQDVAVLIGAVIYIAVKTSKLPITLSEVCSCVSCHTIELLHWSGKIEAALELTSNIEQRVEGLVVRFGEDLGRVIIQREALNFQTPSSLQGLRTAQLRQMHETIVETALEFCTFFLFKSAAHCHSAHDNVFAGGPGSLCF
ncbi:unnamed protein product [Ostreobium quekettii]|uniref:TFIIB-type domain-containing protein n=1 Tax=Ostreobium quekettii TaxID=121088 RepID=A0A8S1J275_9CHLO|nr:unnamed protein product [Ostreobium quekettii]|eukprot:evm.model.scf_569.1 EVM.evm.TU.scf_569.1   scf_569:17044-19378(+)